MLLDELYLEEEYRSKGIGSDILKKYTVSNIIYLWVYRDNKKAVALYERLGFKTIDSTKTRLFMRCN